MITPLLQLRTDKDDDTKDVFLHPAEIASMAAYPSGTTIRMRDGTCYIGIIEAPVRIGQMRTVALEAYALRPGEEKVLDALKRADAP